MYEVGVHIADVSYFVKEDTELDVIASKRATSVYLVQKVCPCHKKGAFQNLSLVENNNDFFWSYLTFF